MRYGRSTRITFIAAIVSFVGVIYLSCGYNVQILAADNITDGEPKIKYVSSIGELVGMLEPYVEFRTNVVGVKDGIADSLKVKFTGYLPFPNPHSTPMPFIVVGIATELCVRISGIGNDDDYLFEFRSVEKGIYRFWLSGPIGSAESYTMTVEVNGETAGSSKLWMKDLVASAK